MSNKGRFYRCKICGIFLSRREEILIHFYDRHSSGQDSFEEVVLPDLKINVTRQETDTTRNKNIPETILLPDNAMMFIKIDSSYEDFENIASPNFTFNEDDEHSSANEKDSCSVKSTAQEDSELINQTVQEEDARPIKRTLRPRKSRKIRKRTNSDKDEEQDDESRDDEFLVESDSEDNQLFKDSTKPKRKRTSVNTKITNDDALIPTKTKIDDSVAKVNRNKTPSSRNRCPFCPAKLTSALQADVHIQRVHQGVENPFNCEICTKSFKSFESVLLHMDIRHQPHVIIASRQTDPDNSHDSALENPKLDKEHLFDKMFKVEEFQTNTEESRDVVQTEPEAMPEEYTRKKKKSYEGRFCCKHCRYHFAQEWVLNAHILRCHYGDTNAFPCDHCSRRFLRKAKLYMHRKISHPSISSPYAGPKISLQEQISQLKSRGLKNQVKPYPSVKSAPMKKFTCNSCQVTLPSRTSCEIHLSRVHQTDQTKLFPCDKCDLIFLTESGRKIHFDHFHVKNIATKLHPLSCTVCSKECTSVLTFSRHQEIVHSSHPRLSKEHLCELCSQVFTQLVDLKRHQVRVHHAELGVDPLFKCSHCGKVLNTKRSLKRHEAMHGDTLPFVCTQAPCTKGFLFETDLEKHVTAVHLKEKNFVCEFCSKAFAQKPNLITHLRTHTGEKPYKCRSCGKEFSDKPTYNRHVQIHGDTVHTCDKCGREFKVWHTYKVHLKTHN